MEYCVVIVVTVKVVFIARYRVLHQTGNVHEVSTAGKGIIVNRPQGTGQGDSRQRSTASKRFIHQHLDSLGHLDTSEFCTILKCLVTNSSYRIIHAVVFHAIGYGNKP